MSSTTPSLGRSLLAGQCTVTELFSLTNKFAIGRNYVRNELASYAYDSVVVDGDLEIDGDLDTFAHKVCRLVVTGSLRVTGLYRDHEDPETAVFVLGDFVAGRAITNGALAVAGNVTVHDTLVGYYNDHSAELLGNVTARVFVPENHFFSIHGKLSAEHVLGSGAQYRVPPKLKTVATPVDDARLRQLLVEDVLEIEDYGDPSEVPEIMLAHEVIRRRVADNVPILRGDAPRTPVPAVLPVIEAEAAVIAPTVLTKKAAPKKMAAPTKKAAPKKKAKPTKQGKPTKQAKPTKKAAPKKKAAPTKQAKPTKPTKQAKPTKKAKPTKQARRSR